MGKTENQRRVKKKNDGITLIALVVTIIVLMILAGTTLRLVLGQNGLITKTQEAKAVSVNADKATAEGLNSLDSEIELLTSTKLSDVSTIKDAISKNARSTTGNIGIKDDGGNTVTIPAGFHIASDSATKQEQGIVIEDKDGNQFVWIPVANISNYIRTNFGLDPNGGGYNSYSETMPSDEQTSINTYHGYYMGRYEAGDITSTANKALRATGASITNKVSIKKGQAPYNYVTINQAKTLATGMETAEGYNATTKLCSSYAWDTAINFIQKAISNYGISSNQGNYYDTTFKYIDITGATQTKAISTSVLVPTGQNIPVCNIYDMGGNDTEWTTETCTASGYNSTTRGGSYSSGYSNSGAGYRTCASDGCYGCDLDFRVTLYM